MSSTYYLTNDKVKIEGTLDAPFKDVVYPDELLKIEKRGNVYFAQIGTSSKFVLNHDTFSTDNLIELSQSEYENILQLQQAVEKLQDLANLNASHYYISASVVDTITSTLQSAKDAYITALDATRQANIVEQTAKQTLNLDDVINDYKRIELLRVDETEATIFDIPLDEERLLTIADRTNILEKAGIARDDATEYLKVNVMYDLLTDEVNLVVNADNPETHQSYYKSEILQLQGDEAQSVKDAFVRCAADEGLTLKDYDDIAKGKMKRPLFEEKSRNATVRE